MDWRSTYASKRTTPQEAVRLVKSGDRVFLTGNCSVPHLLLNALIDYAHELTDVQICQALTVACADYVKPEFQGHLRVNSLFISHNVRQAVQSGAADFTPVLLSEFPLLFKNKILPVDVAFIHVSPPDDDGFCSLGIESGLTISAAESSPTIIAQVNHCMPVVYGDTRMHIDRMDAIIEVDEPLSELAMGSQAVNPVIEKMAGFIADLIPDGATMQMGIGEIPDAVLNYLFSKKNLGIHSELFSDGVVRLVEAGVVTGAEKAIHTGKISAGFIIGTRKLYDWENHNPMVELQRTEYINNPFVIAQNKRVVAINSAIEVDLTGQVCADSIGTRFYSGVGGQSDFIYGASLSEGGVPIIALPSTTRLSDGSIVSRIVPTLKPGAGVTTSRNHVHWVATEYGMVDLYGCSIAQRAKKLISIAHPDFRADLLKTASEIHYI